MSWQAWCVLAVVLTIGAIGAAISSIDSDPVRLRAAACLGAGAAAAYVISAAIARPA